MGGRKGGRGRRRRRCLGPGSSAGARSTSAAPIRTSATAVSGRICGIPGTIRVIASSRPPSPAGRGLRAPRRPSRRHRRAAVRPGRSCRYAAFHLFSRQHRRGRRVADESKLSRSAQRRSGRRRARARCRRSPRPAGRRRDARRPAAAPTRASRAPAPMLRPRADARAAPPGRAPSPTSTPSPSSTGPVDLSPVAEARRVAVVDQLARGLDADRAGEHVEVALQVLGQRADVVPVVVDRRGRRTARRPRAAPGRRRGRSRPPAWSGKWSKISGSST